jgi:membrane protein YdbS with pleckstrin-like domain
MPEIADALFSDEKISHQVRRHWIASLLSALFGAFLFASGLLIDKLYLQVGDGEERSGALLMSGVYVVVSVLLLLLAARLRTSPQLAVTNLRVIATFGVIYTRILTIPITAIEDVHTKQGIFGRMLGYTNITIQRRDYPPLVLCQIQDGDQFRREVLLLKYELAHSVRVPQGSFGMVQLVP